MKRRGFLGLLTGLVAAPFVPAALPTVEPPVTGISPIEALRFQTLVNELHAHTGRHTFVAVTAFGDSHPIYVLADRPVERDA